MDDTGIKREPVIRISSDRMEAFIMLPAVEEEWHYTVDEVLEAVNLSLIHISEPTRLQ